MSITKRTKEFILAHEISLPIFLLIIFAIASIPGIGWGTPDLWNPDELVGRVDLALGGEIQFDDNEPNYNYPSLPKYMMYGVGEIVYGLGYSRTEFIISARMLSVLLGGLAVILVYFLARRIGAGVPGAFLAGLLMTASGVIPFNARFAHNDLYLNIFVLICIYCAIHYQLTKNRLWLYGSFYSAGLAASSKYTGVSMILLPLFVFVVLNWKTTRNNLLEAVELLIIGIILTYLGFGTGTPKAILWPAFYFKRMIPAAANFAIYGMQPNSQIGLFGQWKVFYNTVGGFPFYFFLIAGLWFVIKLILAFQGRAILVEERRNYLIILFGALIIFDLPFLISVNYIGRFFIPFVPILLILTAIFITELTDLLREKNNSWAVHGLVTIIVIGMIYSLLRVVSTALLFVNDARKPASEYLLALQPGTVIEYTLYPPIIPQGWFAVTRNYPIFFLKYPGESVPTNKPYVYNSGEPGLIKRNVDYLVVDSYTYARFADEYICNSNPVECDFFSSLLAGETSFHLLREFKYTLPPYLPQISLAAVNPDIRVYERIQ